MRIAATFVQSARDRAGPALLALALSLACAWAAAAFPGALRSFLWLPRAGLEFFLRAKCLDAPDGSIILPAYGSRLDMSCSGLGTLCLVEFAAFLAASARTFRTARDDDERVGRDDRIARDDRGGGTTRLKRILGGIRLYLGVMGAVLGANAFRILFAHAALPAKRALGLGAFWGHRLEGFIIMGFTGVIAVRATISISERRTPHAFPR